MTGLEEQHVCYAPASVGEECALCGVRICSGDTYYLDADGMPICEECAS